MYNSDPTTSTPQTQSPTVADAQEILKTLHLLFQPGDVVELRSPKFPHGGTVSGYYDYDHLNALAKDATKLDREGAKALYVTMNPALPDLLARRENRYKPWVDNGDTTNDDQIVRRRWLLIDCDPKRVAGISASDDEHALALAKGDEVTDWLRGRGWPEAIHADSGNGYHAVYGVDLPNDDASEELLKNVLAALSGQFGSDAVEIDKGVYNAARITKLYGTTARKGENTDNRPHRRSKILFVPEGGPQIVSESLLKAVAALAAAKVPPKPTQPGRRDETTDRIREALNPRMVEIAQQCFPGPTSTEGHNGCETRIHGNGGLLINTEKHVWKRFGATGEGDVFDLIGYSEFGDSWNKHDGGMFKHVLGVAAWQSGIELPPGTVRLSPRPPVAAPDGSMPAVSVDETFPAEDLSFVARCLARQQLGDAELVARLYQGRLAYISDEKSWYLWTGHSYRKDNTLVVPNLLENAAIQYEKAANVYHGAAFEIAQGDDDKVDGNDDGTGPKTDAQAIDMDAKQSATYLKRARNLRKHQYKTQVLNEVATLQNVSTSPDCWEKEPMLLATPNGVIDLRTGEFGPGLPSQRLRTSIPTEWKGIDEPCPAWEKFIADLFVDPEVALFMNRLLGYSVTGDVREQVMVVCHGANGSNGKSTMFETLSAVMGDFAKAVSNDVLVGSGRTTGGATDYLADLQGVRLAYASETDKSDRINTAQIKQLTGGDTVRVRHLYQNSFALCPTHKIFVFTNHKPRIDAEDGAMWRRMVLIPFELRFVENPTSANERLMDKDLKAKLLAERSGILAWLVRGCLTWFRKGLNPPASVLAATSEYRAEEDRLADFVDECCTVVSGGKARAARVYGAYRAWAEQNGEHPLTNTNFGRQFAQKFAKDRDVEGAFYAGLTLKENGSRLPF